MPAFHKTVFDRQADQAKAKEARAAVAKALVHRPAPKKPEPARPVLKPVAGKPERLPTSSPDAHPWKVARFEPQAWPYLSRETEQPLGCQPWTQVLVNAVLGAAQDKSVHLVLSWPGRLKTLSVLHGLADMTRLKATDLRGLSTLMYPATYATRSALQSVAVSRASLCQLLGQELWRPNPHTGLIEMHGVRLSEGREAMLKALKDVQNWHPEQPSPVLGELTPVFMFDNPERGWHPTVPRPMERTLSKVEKLHHRRQLREQVINSWSNLTRAPGPLLMLHHSLTSVARWKQALEHGSLTGIAFPEVALLDATQGAQKNHYSAVQKIGELSKHLRSLGAKAPGQVILCDEPKMYFVLRAQLLEQGVRCQELIFANEAEEPFLAESPVVQNWAPAVRSNAHFAVSIVDRDASQVALSFQKLAQRSGPEGTPAHQALLRACTYLLSLSNLPAGYRDLLSAANNPDVGRMQTWGDIELEVRACLQSGALNQLREKVQETVNKAQALIDAWSDGTPMAIRLLQEVRKKGTGRATLHLVMPSRRYVEVAQFFLERQLGERWSAVSQLLQWHTLASVQKTLERVAGTPNQQYVVLGLTADVLRFLLSNEHIPHGSAVLVAYKQAESAAKTLKPMLSLDAFRPYKGRIGLMVQELERRLAEVPHPIEISVLREFGFNLKVEPVSQDPAEASVNATFFKFELEGGLSAYSSGWVYRYEPDSDPFFRRVGTASVAPGDLIFHMSDELRTKIESELGLVQGHQQVTNPLQLLLRLYKSEVHNRCLGLFGELGTSGYARKVHEKMAELDAATAQKCRVSRVVYWLSGSATSEDKRPHASRDFRLFKLFAQALGIEQERAQEYWGLIREVRAMSIVQGRQLMARYAEVLFAPDSAQVYRHLSRNRIEQLQRDAVDCVYRVNKVFAPQAA